MTTVARRSPRIRALNVRQYGDIKKTLLLESRTITAISRSTYADYKRNRRHGIDCVTRIYKIIIDNFQLILVTEGQTAAEKLLQVMYQRIDVLRTQIVEQKLNRKYIMSVFNVYTKQYRAYHRNKIQAMVLITRRFSPDIVRLISTYYLSPTNFVH